MNANAKLETITIRVTSETKDALRRRAIQSEAIVNGVPSVSLVVHRLIETAKRHWPKEAATSKETK